MKEQTATAALESCDGGIDAGFDVLERLDTALIFNAVCDDVMKAMRGAEWPPYMPSDQVRPAASDGVVILDSLRGTLRGR